MTIKNVYKIDIRNWSTRVVARPKSILGSASTRCWWRT
jgi:hypothetical protein